MHLLPCWRRILCCLVLVCPAVCPANEAGPTEDQLEYGTRSKDRRFLHKFAAEVSKDFNAPFDMLAQGQAWLVKETGVRLYFDYYGDFLANPTGGISQSVGYSHEIVVGGHFEPEAIRITQA